MPFTIAYGARKPVLSERRMTATKVNSVTKFDGTVSKFASASE